MPLLQKNAKLYTVEDIYALPEGVRAELVEGHIYYMTPPSRRHQKNTSFFEQKDCGLY